MNPLAVCLLATAFCLPALSAPVPPGIDEALKNIKLKSRSLEGGTLRIVMNVPLVSRDMYWSAVWMTCSEQWANPASLRSTRIDRIEVLNHVDAQGFALPGGKATCDVIGKMKGDRSERYVQDRAESCEAGVCRKRD